MYILDVPRAAFDDLTIESQVVDLGSDQNERPVRIGPLVQDEGWWLRWTGSHPHATNQRGESRLVLFETRADAEADDEERSFLAVSASCHVDGWHSHPDFAVFRVINVHAANRRICRRVVPLRTYNKSLHVATELCDRISTICAEHNLETFGIEVMGLHQLEELQPA